MKKINFGVLLLLVSMTACNGNNNESTNESSSVQQVSSEEVVESSTYVSSEESESVSESISSEETSNTDFEAEYTPLTNWKEEKLDISLGGDLIDVSVGRPFMTGGEYDIFYTLGTSLPPSNSANERLAVSNSKVFTVEKTDSGITLKCLHQGQAYLRIYDSNDVIRYCALITVLDPIPLKDMEEYLVYDCEYWVSVMSWVDNFVITFNEGGQYTITGYLENVPFQAITGTYEYVQTLNNGKEYEYKFTDQDIRQIGLTGFHVATTGKFMYLQDNWGTAAILFPIEEIEVE